MGYMGSCYNIPEAIFYLRKGDYIVIVPIVRYLATIIICWLLFWFRRDSDLSGAPKH